VTHPKQSLIWNYFSHEIRKRRNGWIESFRTKCLPIFDPLENILDEWKTRSWDQNFVLFPNMGSEIVYLFLSESSDGTFERPKKIVWTKRSSGSFWTLFCLFLAYLKVFWMNEKLWARARILCSFLICAQKFCIYFCTRVVRVPLNILKLAFGGEQKGICYPRKSLCKGAKNRWIR